MHKQSGSRHASCVFRTLSGTYDEASTEIVYD